MTQFKKQSRTLLTGFSDGSLPPDRKPNIFCKYVPNEHTRYIEGVHYPSERFLEVTACPLLKWAESNQDCLCGFCYRYDTQIYCRQYGKNLPRCPIMEWMFNNNEALIDSIIKPPFTPAINIEGLKQLLEWFIDTPITVPTDSDIRPEHQRFLFHAYHESACSRVLTGSGITGTVAALHNFLETQYETPPSRIMADNLKKYWDALSNKAHEVDLDNQQFRRQGWIPQWMATINDRLFDVKQEAAALLTRLSYIEATLLRTEEDKKTGFRFLLGQVMYDGKVIPLSVGRRPEILKKLVNNLGKIVDYKDLDSTCVCSANEQLRTDITEIRKALKTAKVPFTVTVKRTFGYFLKSKN